MTFDEFISIFIEDCEDHLELFNKGDFDKVFTYLDKNINKVDGSQDQCRSILSIFINFINDSNVDMIYEYNPSLYFYLCSRLGIEKIHLNTESNDYRVNRYRIVNDILLDFFVNKDIKLKTVSIDDRHVLECFKNFNKVGIQELIISKNFKHDVYHLQPYLEGILDIDNLVIESNNLEGLFIHRCKSLYFKDDISKLPITLQLNNIDNIYLPSTDQLSIPHSLCKIPNKDVRIYKRQGQKLIIPSIYKEWIINHVKSI